MRPIALWTVWPHADQTRTSAERQIRRWPNAGAYSGPWGFMTLGGAGGQTVFGALTTGTHGGDFRQRPISDAVVALHLVTDGGDHFWIEPSSSPDRVSHRR